MSGPPPGFSIPSGATGSPPGITGFPTSLPSGIPSGVIPSGIIPTGAIPSDAIPSGVMGGPPPGFSGMPPGIPFPPDGLPGSSGPSVFLMAKFNSPEIVALGNSAIGICWASCGLAVIFVGLRLLTRLTKRGSAGWDDATIAVAVLLSIGGAVSNTLQHNSPQISSAFTSSIIAAQMLNFLTLGFMRLSIALFCLRLLPPNTRYPKYAIWIAILLNFIATALNVGFFAAARQFPTNGAPPSSNSGMNHAFIASGIISVFVDFITVLTPLAVVRGLQMKKSLKIGVMVIMSLSLLTASLSIGKVIVTANMNDPSHIPRNVIRIQIFSNLEQNMGIVFASCPALRQFYGYAETRIRTYYMSSSGASRSGKSGGSASGDGSTGSKKQPLLGSGSGASTSPGKSTRQNTDKSLASAVSSDNTTSSANHDRDLEKGVYSYSLMPNAAKTNTTTTRIATANPEIVGRRTSISVQSSDRNPLHDVSIAPSAPAATAAGHTGTSQGWKGPEPSNESGNYAKESAPSVLDGVDCAVERGRTDFKLGVATRKFGWLFGRRW